MGHLLVPMFLGLCVQSMAKPLDFWGTSSLFWNTEADWKGNQVHWSRRTLRNVLSHQIAGEWMFTPQHNPIGIESSPYPSLLLVEYGHPQNC